MTQIPEIPGLYYIDNFLTPSEENTLLHGIDNQTWMNELKRRVQHYGYRYDYKAKAIDQTMRLGLLPHWSEEIVTRLVKQKLIKEKPDQLIVNEYQPGQGIAAHIDCIPCFEDGISIISLLSPCLMEFTHKKTGSIQTVLLQPCSCLILQLESRYEWTHAIRARKNDVWNGIKYPRKRRISLTFRKVTS
jgi:alkylated DNA repair dioxygenase AlkB